MNNKKNIFLFLVTIFFANWIAPSLAQNMLFHLLSQNSVPPYIWTGLAGDNNWSTTGNWSTNVVPGSGDIALFRGANCVGAACNVTVNANINIAGIDIDSAYAGTITQASTRTITVGTSGWVMAGGTFAGGDSAITLNSALSLSAGSFTSTSGVLKFWTRRTTNGATVTHLNFTGGTFAHNNGTLQFNSYQDMTWGNDSTGNITIPNGLTAYNLEFTIDSISNASHYFTLGAGQTITVVNNLSLYKASGAGNSSFALNNGTILLSGNISIADRAGGGSTVIEMTGAAAKTYTYTGGTGPTLKINKAGGSVTPAGGTTTLQLSAFELAAGSFTAPSGVMTLYQDDRAIYNSTMLKVTGGTFTHSSGTVQLNIFDFTQYNTTNISLDIQSAMTLYNLEFVANNTQSDYWTNSQINWSLGASQSLTVANNFSILGGTKTNLQRFNNGTYLIAGNILSTGYVFGGTSILELNGTGAQTYTNSSSWVRTFPGLKINKASGSVTAAGGQTDLSVISLNIAAGTFVAPTGVLEIAQDVNYHSSTLTQLALTGGTFTHNSGTLRFNHTPLSSGFSIATNTLNLPAGITVNNVEFLTNGNGQWGGPKFYFNTASDSMTVLGNLSIQNTNGSSTYLIGVYTGTIYVAGNVTEKASVHAAHKSGDAKIVFNGTGAQSWTHTAGYHTEGLITVNKASGTTTLTTNVSLSAAGQDLTVSAGTLAMAGFSLAVNDVLTIASGATLDCGGGTLTYGSLVNNGIIANCVGAGFTWDGSAGDGNWNTAANWSGNAVPGASDVAIFGTLCSGVACNATVNVAATPKGIIMLSTYTGTLTQAHTITVGSSGWTQAGGTFAGASQSISMTGPFNLSGGSFTSTSGTLTMTNAPWSITGASTFTHNSGTLFFTGNAFTTYNFIPGTGAYNNVTLAGFNTYNFGGGTLIVNGTLTAGNTLGLTNANLNNGTISARGNVTFNNFGHRGSALIQIAGTGNQTVSGVDGAGIPDLQIISTGGTVTLSGTLNLMKSYTYTSGTMAVAGSVLKFGSGTNASCASCTIIPGGIAYNDVTFNGMASAYDLNGGTLIVSGLLTVGDGNPGGNSINNGDISARGNVTFNNNGYGGTAWIRIAGTGNQTISGVAGAVIPNFQFINTGGIVTVSGTLNFIRDYTYTSGTMSWGASVLKFGTGTSLTSSSVAIIPGPINYGNVTFNGYATAFGFGTNTMTVAGALTVGDAVSGNGFLNAGTIVAKGDVTFNNTGTRGSALIRIGGSGNQTVSGISAAHIPNFEVASTGGTVTFSGTLTMMNNYTRVSGNIASGTSLVKFGNGANLSPGSATINANGTYFNDLTINGFNSVYTLSNIVNVNGTLTLGDSYSGVTSAINSSSFSAFGNVIYNNFGYPGTSALAFVGTTSSTVSAAAGTSKMSGAVVFLKYDISATVTLLDNVSWNAAGQGVWIYNTAVNMNGKNLTVNNQLLVGPGASLTCNGGTLAYGSLNNSGTIDCVGYAYNWVGGGGAGNKNWNHGPNWQGGAAPGVNHMAVFKNAYCGANCNATINVNPNIQGIQMMSGYTGTITQSAGVNINIGSGGWIQESGTFVGSNGYITTGSLLLSGGTFTSSSTDLYVNHTLSTIGGSFVHNSGTLNLYPSSLNGSLTLGGDSFNNVIIDGIQTYDLNGTTLTVDGNLIMNGSSGPPLNEINNGQIYAKGNVNIQANGYTGTAELIFGGSSTVFFTVDPGASVVNIVNVDKSGGAIVALPGDVTVPDKVNVINGVLDLNGHSLTVTNDVSNLDTIQLGTSGNCGVLSYGGFYSGNPTICP